MVRTSRTITTTLRPSIFPRIIQRGICRTRFLSPTACCSAPILLRYRSAPWRAASRRSRSSSREPSIDTMTTLPTHRCFIRWKASWSIGHITFADLKGVLTHVLRQIFSQETGVRFRPEFLSFHRTERRDRHSMFNLRWQRSGFGRPDLPGLQRTGWLEILGAGMIDPQVFRFVATIRRKSRDSLSAWV